MLCSVAVDLRISEIVDVPNPVVSALCPLDIFHSTPPRRGDEMTDTTTADHDLYARQGIGSQIGFGEHPAVIVVDYQFAFTRGALAGDYPEAALRSTARIAARRARSARPSPTPTVPTSRISRMPAPSASSAPAWSPARAAEGCDIDPLVTPRARRRRVREAAALGVLRHAAARAPAGRGIDTVIVCGTTTSGCVRATVVDGMSLGYRMVVPVEAVSDRARTPHRSALFDMGHKYADVLPERDVLAALGR